MVVEAVFKEFTFHYELIITKAKNLTQMELMLIYISL